MFLLSLNLFYLVVIFFLFIVSFAAKDIIQANICGGFSLFFHLDQRRPMASSDVHLCNTTEWRDIKKQGNKLVVASLCLRTRNNKKYDCLVHRNRKIQSHLFLFGVPGLDVHSLAQPMFLFVGASNQRRILNTNTRA